MCPTVNASISTATGLGYSLKRVSSITDSAIQNIHYNVLLDGNNIETVG